MKKSNLLFYLLTLLHFGFSQSTIKGSIKDVNTGQTVPFASVGVAGTFHGVLSDQNGNFELSSDYFTDRDTIRISSIGYHNLSVEGRELKKNPGKIFYLKPMVYDLAEIKVKPKNLGYKTLGISRYSKNVCTAFIGENANWKGEQAAVRTNNKDTNTVYIESFGFYIIKNEYTDSLQFRIMLYEVDLKGYPGKTFLKKPILFKTNVKEGEVQIDLKDYFINTTGDFFISLECLEEKIEPGKFCFAGSIKVPSFVKTSAFGKWTRVKGGGGDFNVKVSYVKSTE
ncbi:MAG TPA: carboxypeptidase-like regulatory domain-containing protein [Bacteroidia bacterium]|jgi:hypothetical protein|nr:carboxypeptidase-like regulatory domain-containing protein [Bacteroidia bacterium]